MTEQRTWRERISNRLFAIPTVAEWWAKVASARTRALVDGAIPFARLQKPLHLCRVALITTAGVHLRNQPPFDMQNPNGDASYRELPAATPIDALMITHKYYDHTDADSDINIVFPLEHFRSLVGKGVLGSLAPRHFGLMGHIDGPLVTTLTEQTAPAVAATLRADGVDFVFLTPA